MPLVASQCSTHPLVGMQFIVGLVLGCRLFAGHSSSAPENPSAPNGALVVMTYNVRSASRGSPVAWDLRRPLMRECLRQYSPDVIGTQEAYFQQLKDLIEDFPEYAWIGQCRDGGSSGEFTAVFYRKSRFEPLAFDHFWLSDTPETIGSKTWGSQLPPRMVTWVRVLDRQTKREFYVFTTHVDGNKQAQEKSVRLIRQRVAALEPVLPVLLTGDFNAVPGKDKAYDLLVGDEFFADSWTRARERRGEGFSTFNGFKTLVKNERRIDWILARGVVTVEAAETVTFAREGKFPSDHLPVVAWLRFP
jgi:endonuclease/exonuclease/phosphatase family metal-dependent hydrolase